MTSIPLPLASALATKGVSSVPQRPPPTGEGHGGRTLSRKFLNKSITQTSESQSPSTCPLVTQHYSLNPPSASSAAASFPGVPPTGPLPPTPLPESAELEHGKLPNGLERMDGDNHGQLGKKISGTVPTVEVVVGVVASGSGGGSSKRPLRRVKGNITAFQRREAFESPAPSERRRSTGSIAKITNRNGFSTRFSALSFTVLPLPNQERAPSVAEHSHVHEGSTDGEDDGGIAISYDNHGHRTWFNGDGERKSECSSSPGIPRPDSPYLLGSAFQSHGDDADTASESRSTASAAIRSPVCRPSQPEFTAPVRVDHGTADTDYLDPQCTPPTTMNGTNPPTITRPVIPVRRASTAATAGLARGEVGPKKMCKKAPSKVVAIATTAREQAQSLCEVDIMIRRSSIAKRRLSISRNETLEKNGAMDDMAKGKESQTAAEKHTETEGEVKDNRQPPSDSKVVVLYEPPSIPAEQNDKTANPRSLFTPPSLPRFNFIPPTPLPLSTPNAFLEKQLGEIPQPTLAAVHSSDNNIDTRSRPTPPPRKSSARPASRLASQTRPLLASQPSRLRESKLHPWWKPRSFWQEPRQDLAELLVDVENVHASANSKVASEEDQNRSGAKERRRRWSGGGLAAAGMVDKKRRVINLGKVQIEFIGMNGLKGKFKAWNRKDEMEETDRERSMESLGACSSSNKLQKKKAGKRGLATDF